MKFLIVVPFLLTSAFAAHIHARSGVMERSAGYDQHSMKAMNGEQEKAQWEQENIAARSGYIAHRSPQMTGDQEKAQWEQENFEARSGYVGKRSPQMTGEQEKAQWEQENIADRSGYVAKRSANQMTGAEEKFEMENSNAAVQSGIASRRSNTCCESDSIAEQEGVVSMREGAKEQQQNEFEQTADKSNFAEKRAMMMPMMNQARASMQRPRGQMRANNAQMY